MMGHPEYMALYVSEWKKRVRRRRLKKAAEVVVFLLIGLLVGVVW